MCCVVFLIFYGEYGVEFAVVASTVAAMLMDIAVRDASCCKAFQLKESDPMADTNSR